MRPTLVTLLGAGLLAGCSHAAIHVLAAKPADLPSGWTQGSDPQDGITIGVPGGWRQGADRPMDAMGMAGQMGSDMSQAPDVNGQTSDAASAVNQLAQSIDASGKEAEQKELARLRKGGVVLQVIDSSKPTIGEERTRFYVKRTDSGGNATLDQAADMEKDHLRMLGADLPKTVALPIGPAVRFDADAKSRGGDELTHISYVVVDGKSIYSLRFVSTNNPQVIQSIADQVAQSWRITPGKG